MQAEEVTPRDKVCAIEMRCHRGHVNALGLWNCPRCTDPAMDFLRAHLLPLIERFESCDQLSKAAVALELANKSIALLTQVPR